MKIDPNRVSTIFLSLLGLVLAGFTVNALYKLSNGVGIEQNSAGAYSHPLADLAIIGLIVLTVAGIYLVRWYQRRDERDFVKKYKK